MALKRDAIKPPTLPRETYPCPELGGEVIIRGPLASARIAMQRHATDPGAGVEQLAPILLAASVLDADDQPIFSAEQWDAWGGGNYEAYIGLFNAAMRLWGFDSEANRKN